jgi:hypothetical protein
MQFLAWLRALPSRLKSLLVIAIGMMLPEYLLDPDPPWWRKYENWPKP